MSKDEQSRNPIALLYLVTSVQLHITVNHLFVVIRTEVYGSYSRHCDSVGLIKVPFELFLFFIRHLFSPPLISVAYTT